jgi:cysteine desulfurase
VVYFDHNATSPLTSAGRDAWLNAIERFIGNPSSPHRLGARAENALAEARRNAAGHLGCSEFDLVWTSGATEANNAIFYHAAARGGEAWISSVEHPSVFAPACKWFSGRCQFLQISSQGVLDLDFFMDELKRSRPGIVSVMAANNETGVLQPWEKARDICREREIPFFCDAAQWVGKELSKGLGECDFLTCCAHKFGGPVGIGLMKVPAQFSGLLVGGPQEDGRRAGTENVAGASVMSAVWTEREERLRKGEADQRLHWRDGFIRGLRAALPEVEILGGESPRLWNTVAALMPPVTDCRRRWVVQLDKLGFAVSTGSACASGKEKPSHVLLAMGCDPAKADRMLRFSAGWETTENDWKMLLEAIKAAFAELGPAIN